MTGEPEIGFPELAAMTEEQALDAASDILSRGKQHRLEMRELAPMMEANDQQRIRLEKFLDACEQAPGSGSLRERVHRALLNSFILESARYSRDNEIPIRSTWEKKSGQVDVVDTATGETLAKSPSDGGLIVNDAAGALWDDHVFVVGCARGALLKGELEMAWRCRRLGAISAICVIEAYINSIAATFVSHGGVPPASMQLELDGSGFVSLGEKLSEWPKAIAGGRDYERGDTLWRRFLDVQRERDSYVHSKERAWSLEPFADKDLIVFPRVVGLLCSRIAKLIGDQPGWFSRWRDFSGIT